MGEGGVEDICDFAAVSRYLIHDWYSLVLNHHINGDKSLE